MWISNVARDIAYGARSLRVNPGFTAVVVTTLALGIGLNTSMFSIINVLIFRALPYPDSSRLVRVFRTSPQSQSWPHSVANFLDHEAQNHVFEKMAAAAWASLNLAKPGAPAEQLHGMAVTGGFFPEILADDVAIGRPNFLISVRTNS